MSRGSPKISAVVLDLGEVLIRLDFSQVMQWKIDRSGTSRALTCPTTLKDALAQMDGWPLYDAFERGLVTESKFLEELSVLFGRAIPMDEFLPIWNSVLQEPVEGVEKILEKLSTKLPLYALTNSNETHIRHAKANFALLKYFRSVYTSFELGARKPERKVYESLQTLIHCRPQEILFLDDRLENVEGARNCGWHAEQCDEPQKQFIEILRSYQVL